MVADALGRIDRARFAGITTFPALLFDQVTGKVTPNRETLRKAAKALARSGRRKIEISASGTTRR